jgi:uncharacterized membrane protein
MLASPSRFRRGWILQINGVVVVLLHYYHGYLHNDYYVCLAYDLSSRCYWTAVVPL